MKNAKLILTALWLACLALPAEASKPISERKRQEQIFYFHEGKKRAMFGDSRSAILAFNRALRADPYCDACFYELAGIAIASNRRADALTFSRNAYNLDSTNVWYTMRYAQQLALSGQLREAALRYERVIALNSGLREAYLELLLVYDHLERYDEAIAVANVLATIDPTEQGYWLMLAELHGKSESVADSLIAYALERAQAIDPTSQGYLVARADYHRRKANIEGYFDALLTLFSLDETPLAVMQRVLEHSLRFPVEEQEYFDVVDSLYSIARARGYSYQTELLFAKHLLQTHRHSVALMQLKLITTRGRIDDPLLDVITRGRASPHVAVLAGEVQAYVETWSLLFDFLIGNKAWDTLLAELAVYSAFFPRDQFRISYLKGLAHFQNSSYAEALSHWLEAEKTVNSEDVNLRAHLYAVIGDTYFQLGNHSMVDRYFTRSLKLNPRNLVALNNYAYYLSLRRTKLKQALAMSQITIDAEPNNATYLDTYAWVLYGMGQYQEAREVLRRALVNGGYEEGVILEHYGDVLYALDELSNARIYWKRAQEAGNDSPELRKKLEK